MDHVFLLVAAAHLNKMLGVVGMHEFAQKRLLTVIVGGKDGFLSAMFVMNIWRTAQRRKP